MLPPVPAPQDAEDQDRVRPQQAEQAPKGEPARASVARGGGGHETDETVVLRVDGHVRDVREGQMGAVGAGRGLN